MITAYGQFGETEEGIFILVTEVPSSYDQKWNSVLKETKDRLNVLEATPSVSNDGEGLTFTNDVLKLRNEYQEKMNFLKEIPIRETANVVIDGQVCEAEGYKIGTKDLGEQGRKYLKEQFHFIKKEAREGKYLVRLDERFNLLGWRFNPIQ